MAYKNLFPYVLAVALLCFPAIAQQPSSNADTHLMAAQTAQRSGDYSAAEREYLVALTLKPGYAEAHMNLGLTYQLQGRIHEAMVELHRAVKIKPELSGANLMLGIDYCKLNQSAQAIRYLSASLALDRNRVEAYSWLATAQEMSGDYTAELLTIKHALQLQPENLELNYLEGHIYELLGHGEALAISTGGTHTGLSERLLAESYARSTEWPSAVVHFRKALAASPERIGGLHVELGEVLLRAGKLDQAKNEFDNELGLNAQNVRAMYGRGKVRLLEGDLDGCFANWSRALTVDALYIRHLLDSDDVVSGASGTPSYPVAAINALKPRLSNDRRLVARIALTYIMRRQGEDASLSTEELWAAYAVGRSTCTPAAVLISAASGRISDVAACGHYGAEAKSTQAHLLLIVCSLLEMGQYELALDAIEADSRITVGSAEFDYLRARCFEELSTAAYLKLYSIDPNSFRVHQLMADLAYARNDDTKSMEEYRAAIALKPSVPNLHYSLAHVLWKNSDVPAARVEYEAELAITPNHIGALHDLGQTYLMEHDPGKALSLLNQAAAAGGQGPDLDRDLGTAYGQLGQYRNAEAKYKLALANDHDGSIHFKLAAVYRALGEKENAMRESAVAADLNRKYHRKREEQTPQLNAIVE